MTESLTLADPIFHDEDAARAYFEAQRWPDGPYCPHCGSFTVIRMQGAKHRVGAFNCRDCRKAFSATVGTVFESSKVPMHKWLLANHLMNASKKGVSAHQLHRMIDVTYKTAWFMEHRIREAMSMTGAPPLGGSGKIVEADEAYHGKREIPRTPSAQRKGRPFTKSGKSGGAEKRPIVALVERGGEARATHMHHVTGKNLRQYIVKNASRKSRLHTDESNLYPALGKEFATHETVNHSIKEYARGDVTTNSVEGFFGIFKRGMVGIYQHCGEQHLQRYLDEFTFRYSKRSKLGIEDTDRANLALLGTVGKRLTYRRVAHP
jgi:transposase-like protein